jgi:osmotically-inducible protein OsmY
MKDDLRLKKDVLAELEWEPRVNAADIGVIVKDGVVTLTGYVDSFCEKWAAEHTVRSWAEREQAELAAWAAPGISDVEKNIVIRF